MVKVDPCFQLSQAQGMTGLPATLLSILVLASFALVAGGTYLLVRRGERKQGILMLVAAAVMFGNVLVWTV